MNEIEKYNIPRLVLAFCAISKVGYLIADIQTQTQFLNVYEYPY